MTIIIQWYLSKVVDILMPGPYWLHPSPALSRWHDASATNEAPQAAVFFFFFETGIKKILEGKISIDFPKSHGIIWNYMDMIWTSSSLLWIYMDMNQLFDDFTIIIVTPN